MSSIWYVNIDSDPPWLAYDAKDNEKIEKAYAKKAKSLLLNPTYKIDFATMRQVRRDDHDRWRAIKRGGTATDTAPVDPDDDAKDDEEEEEPVKKAPAADWRTATAALPTKKKAANKKADDDDDDGESVASKAPAPTPAPAKKAEVAAAAAAAAVPSAEADRQLASLKSQLHDLEAEMDASEKKHKDEVASLKSQLATAAAAKQDATKETEKVRGELEQLKKDQIQALKFAVSKEQAASSKTIDDLKAKLAKLLIRAEKAESLAETTETIQAELDEAHALYATLINAIKPLIAVFGLDSKTAIGKAVAAFEQLEKSGRISPNSRAKQNEIAASTKVSKKREREEEEEEETEEPQPASKKAKAATPPPPPAAAPVAVVAPAADLVDDDATQPMLAPEPVHAAAASDDDEDMADVSGPEFFSDLTSLTGTALKLSAAKYVPMCFGGLPASSKLNSHAGGHTVLVGCRDGVLDVFRVSGSKSVLEPLKVLPGRPAHQFARPSAKTEDGEDYSKTAHIQAMATVTRATSKTSFALATGEGRLMRIYQLDLSSSPSASSPHTLTFKNEVDVGLGNWVTAITLVKQPGRSDGRTYIAVGVSGAKHGLQLYSFDSTAFDLPRLDRTYPVRSDEVRGVCQLSDGRLVVAGCSSVLDGDLNEGGSIEIWSWDTSDIKGRQFLKNDIRVPSAIGLRCNGIKTWTAASGEDQLLAAYEYCVNGARQLVQYTFDATKGGLDKSATSLEAKHMPPMTENTFTSLDVAASQGKAVAMTYGGKLIIYDIASKKKVHTIDALPESVHEDATQVFLSIAADGSGALLTCGGDKEVKAWATN